ncbi:hypothetical protein ACQP00_25270 [Dactylosporangium sp. CS-047395]|uniref:hypothetical protein n=1 Tax=Dactylosporangium sp. CS-047395 TaxID=3239936 RepID=UPI003D8F004B
MRSLGLTVATALLAVAIALLTGSLEDQIRLPPAVAWTGLAVAVALGVVVARVDRSPDPYRARLSWRWALPSISFRAGMLLTCLALVGVCVGSLRAYSWWNERIVADLAAPVRATVGTATVTLERVTLSRTRLDVTFTVQNAHDRTEMISVRHVCAISDARGRDLWRGTCNPQESALERVVGGVAGVNVPAGQTVRLVTGPDIDDGADATHVYMELHVGGANVLLPSAELKRA